jgi:hypothetical protein
VRLAFRVTCGATEDAALGAKPAPTINLTAHELTAVAAGIRRAIETDRFPSAPRLDPLRSALAKLEPAPAPHPKAPSPAKADKRRAATCGLVAGDQRDNPL